MPARLRFVHALLWVVSSACSAAKAPVPQSAAASYDLPDTPREPTGDWFHGVRVDDPYRWLEDEDAPRVRSWVREQDSLARAYLARQPGRDALARRIRALRYFDHGSPPYRHGERWFVARVHADKEKEVLYHRDSPEGEDHVALDPGAMSADGSASLDGYWPSQSGRYVAYKLSQNMRDVGTLRVRDLTSGQDLPGAVFEGVYINTEPVWSPGDEGFYYVSHPTDAALPLAERFARAELRYHALGTAPEADHTVLGPIPETAALRLNATRDGKWLVVRWSSLRESGIWVKDLAAAPNFSPHPESIDRFHRAGLTRLLVVRASEYEVDAWQQHFYIFTNEGAPHGRVFRADARQLGRPHWREIVPEDPKAILRGASIVGGRLALTWLEDVRVRLEVRDLDGGAPHDIALPGIGDTYGIHGSPDDDTGYYLFHSFTVPPRVFSVSMSTGVSRPWGDLELPIDLSRVVTRQVFFESKDGTRIPMFLVHDRELSYDGDRPTLLTGYGGFGISLLPRFEIAHAVWLEQGGVLAVPNLRGGGEFGSAWRRAGARENKQNTFDDFAAAARWLISQNVTRPGRLAISGASNGGLLVAAAMTQHPELFRAVVCSVPLIDMLGYHRYASNVYEYGSADDPAEFSVLRAYSPYHRVQQGTRYPALLLMSADSDDRVHPMHARKFLAAVQWANAGGAPALLRVERNAGHHGSGVAAKEVEAGADELAFLFGQLGVDVR